MPAVCLTVGTKPGRTHRVGEGEKEGETDWGAYGYKVERLQMKWMVRSVRVESPGCRGEQVHMLLCKADEEMRVHS